MNRYQALDQLEKAEARITALRAALALYEEQQAPGQYQFCGHWAGHGDLFPTCSCDARKGCEKVAALVR